MWAGGGDREEIYDGSGLRAGAVFDILTQKGDAGVWEYLEQEYQATFGKEKA